MTQFKIIIACIVQYILPQLYNYLAFYIIKRRLMPFELVVVEDERQGEWARNEEEEELWERM